MRGRTAWFGVVVAAAIAALGAGGCKPKVKPGLKVTGERLKARFDRPMVAAEALGRDLDDSPLRLEPEVPGKFRWLDARTLAFVPAKPLPRSTRFAAKLEAGTRALDGFGIAEPFEWSFETERLRATFPGRGTTPPEKWATPDQAVALAFNQPVRARDVEKRCLFTSERGRIESGVDTGSAAAGSAGAPEASDHFRVVPRAALALATAWTFRCAPELTGAEGPLGLAAPPGAPGSADGGAAAPVASASRAAEVAFETYGPFTVTAVAPKGADVSPDEGTISIRFSNPLAPLAASASASAGAGTASQPQPLPIEISPAVEGFPSRATVSDDRLTLSVRSLAPHTSYTIKIGAGLVDRFGQKLAQAHEAEFSTGDGAPRLDVETGAWVIESGRPGFVGWTRNLTRIEADVAAVPEAKLGELSARLDWWDAEALDVAKVGLRATHTTIEPKTKPNQWEQISIEPAALLGTSGAPLGFYYVALRAPEEKPAYGDGPSPPRELLLNFTNLGVTAKLSGPSGLVWVTRLSDGQPQAGAEVSFRDGKGKVRWRGTTDADGVAVTPGLAQLRPKAKRAAPRRAAPDGDGDGGGENPEEGMDFAGGGGGERADLLVFARAGNDVTWVNPSRSGGLAAWNFHVATDGSDRAEQLRGFLHSDRGLYRPGDTVHVRGLARTMKLGGALRVPPSKKARVTVRDPRGEQILARVAPLSRYGGFAVDVPLSEGARLGDYLVSATLPEGSFQERFSVEQYRAATFEVKVPPPAREPVAGGELVLGVEARYLYGSPLRKGDLTWRVHRRNRSVAFPKLTGYAFGDERSLYDYWESRSSAGEMLVSEEVQRLDGDGKGRLSLRLPKEDFAEPQDLMVTAEVRDDTNQTIAASLAVPAHPSGIYFGIDRGSPLASAHGSRAVKIIAVDTKGTRVAAEGSFRVVQRDWSCAWEQWGYSGSYRCDKKEPEVLKQAISVRADAPAEVRFTPPRTGEYFLIAEGSDAAGNRTVTADGIWVWGDGVASWRAEEGETFDLVADKPRYAVGDTARLLLKTTVREAAGLLTVERDGVIERRMVKVGAGASTVEIPIKEGWGPNVYASVMLVKGRSGKGSRGLPVMRMGMATLVIDTEPKRLKVAVTTDRETYRPGDTVTAELRVTDGAGKPVQAEVALSAADEGVLSLIAFKTPDPLATFYAQWGLGVSTATQYERLARLPEPGEDRYATGGDGGAPGTFRSRFLATAYWNPAVETDAAGHAKVTFQAPDNLTAYRLMAVAADGGERFGAGDRRVTVRKPLQILSAMPRFLAVGDEARGGVVIANDTGKAGTVVVDAQVAGARLHKGAHQEVAVPAGARVTVALPVRADRAGELRLRVKAQLGDEKDGLEVKLPVQYPAPVETEVAGEGSTKDRAVVALKLPPGVLPGSASLELSTDPDGVAGLEEGLRDLIEYPYGCLEQTTSRLIPLVAVEELAKSLKLASLDGPSLQRFIRAGLGKLERFQGEDGGFSLWYGGKSEPYLTAFALWGLKLAEDAGHKVRPQMLQRGIGYLHAALNSDEKVAGPIDDFLGEMGSRAFAVHVLALLDRPNAGYASKLLEKKDQLPRFGTAFLARALAADLGAKHASVIALLDDLAGAAQPAGAAGSLIRERPGHDLGYYMSDDVRTTAIATDAFLDLRPSEPLLPKLVKALFGERVNGRWVTTQDNLYALVALAHYVKSRPASNVSVAAELGGKPVLSGELSGKTMRIRRASVPLDAGAPPGELTLKAEGGEVFYSALLRFRRGLPSQKAYEHGISVRRDYLDPATDAPIDPAKGIAAGGMVRVRVTVSSASVGNHLAIDDPLPAGLEAVNTRLVTSGGGPSKRDAGRGYGEGEGEGVDDGDGEDEAYYWQPAQRELRDDRVLVFIERLPSGPQTFEYLARATTPGTFVVPGVSASEMYQPEITARTAPLTFVVREK